MSFRRMGEPEYASQRHLCRSFLSDVVRVHLLCRAVTARRDLVMRIVGEVSGSMSARESLLGLAHSVPSVLRVRFESDPSLNLEVQFGGDVGMLDRERARWLGLALSPRTPLHPQTAQPLPRARLYTAACH
jgi:hypothetical protein